MSPPPQESPGFSPGEDVNYEDTEAMASNYLGDTGWSLVPTPEGWLIQFSADSEVTDIILFVEKTTGYLLVFPATVSIQDIKDKFSEVRYLSSDLSL